MGYRYVVRSEAPNAALGYYRHESILKGYSETVVYDRDKNPIGHVRFDPRTGYVACLFSGEVIPSNGWLPETVACFFVSETAFGNTDAYFSHSAHPPYVEHLVIGPRRQT